MNITNEIAECVGLWLAEGNNKCNNEITLTNNCLGLIKLFHKNLKNLFEDNPNIRLYIYAKNRKKLNIPIKVDTIKYYIDNRATKPYFIWRLASVELMRKWKTIVELTKKNKKFQNSLLQGFFAGEGGVKSVSHYSRGILISQAKRNELIENILNRLNVEYRFNNGMRSYIIYGRNNWDKLAKIKIADLHPDKKLKFWKIYNEFKEYHYKRGYLKKEILKILNKPYTNEELSIQFNRSKARIYDILGELKKKNKIKNFRIKSKDYWILNSQNIILISEIKNRYLNIFKKVPKRTKDIAEEIGVSSKAASNRLKELEKLGLVKRHQNKIWEVINMNKKVIVI